MTTVLEFRAREADETPLLEPFDSEAGIDSVRHIDVHGRHLIATLADDLSDPRLSGVPVGRVEITPCDEGGFMVDDPITGVYGHGDTPNEAFDDFVFGIMDYRDVLVEEGEANLSPRLREHLSFIDTLIPRR